MYVEKFRYASTYLGNGELFETTVTLDLEQLKSADHDDIKHRSVPTSFHIAGEDPEAGVITIPGKAFPRFLDIKSESGMSGFNFRKNRKSSVKKARKQGGQRALGRRDPSSKCHFDITAQ